MSGKKVTNLVIMAVMAFALILAIQGILGVLDKFKSDEPGDQGVPSTMIPLLPAFGQFLPQGITQLVLFWVMKPSPGCKSNWVKR